jgi:hypothetical protein
MAGSPATPIANVITLLMVMGPLAAEKYGYPLMAVRAQLARRTTASSIMTGECS